ncbi:hypothetical protein NQ318_016288 [Aromia moschata]|uniref:PiggyBac transposable element-derived protein domain-containing protein n=1 Tax=Aromia moschata TaxID=1265417 RepID=A0AAV8XYI8_9CUCU|nr:hypothetical protein NQ318_016288 [Aromia moschata]
MFVFWSNNYAIKKNRTGNITHEEMYAFIGILLLNGYLHMPRRRMFWEKRIYMQNILFAHYLFDKLNKIFQEYAPYWEQHSFDESMIPYFRKHVCKQFIRGKFNKIWLQNLDGCDQHWIWIEPYHGANSKLGEFTWAGRAQRNKAEPTAQCVGFGVQNFGES